MRFALISMLRNIDDQRGLARGELLLAGKSIARRQLELALALGAERIICLADGPERPVLALQKLAEGGGARFNIVKGARALVGLIGTADDLLVFADGLLPADEARKPLESGPAVLVLPVDKGLAAGFERIDLNHAWAGALAMPGRLVERLAELPPECDAISALLRIALQAKIPERALPEAVLDEQRWAMLIGEEQAAQIEPAWFRRHAAPASPFAPGRALARLAMPRLGSAMLARGWKPAVMAGFGVLFGVLAAGAGWLGQPVAGFALCALGWLLVEIGAALGRIVRAGLFVQAAGWAIDAGFVAVAAFGLPGDSPARLFAPLVLLGLLRVAGGAMASKRAEFFEDRVVLALVLGGTALAGQLLPAIQLLVIALIVLLIALSGRRARLTQA